MEGISEEGLEKLRALMEGPPTKVETARSHLHEIWVRDTGYIQSPPERKGPRPRKAARYGLKGRGKWR